MEEKVICSEAVVNFYKKEQVESVAEHNEDLHVTDYQPQKQTIWQKYFPTFCAIANIFRKK